MRARLPPPGGGDTKRLLRPPPPTRGGGGSPRGGRWGARGAAAPRHFNRLQRAALAAGYLNGTLGQAQTPGQELDYGPVGPALERRRGHAHAQGAVVHSDAFFPAGSRLPPPPAARAPRRPRAPPSPRRRAPPGRSSTGKLIAAPAAGRRAPSPGAPGWRPPRWRPRSRGSSP